jgi:hypothetical protein
MMHRRVQPKSYDSFLACAWSCRILSCRARCSAAIRSVRWCHLKPCTRQPFSQHITIHSEFYLEVAHVPQVIVVLVPLLSAWSQPPHHCHNQATIHSIPISVLCSDRATALATLLSRNSTQPSIYSLATQKFDYKIALGATDRLSCQTPWQPSASCAWQQRLYRQSGSGMVRHLAKPSGVR